jgi:uncharacterized protein
MSNFTPLRFFACAALFSTLLFGLIACSPKTQPEKINTKTPASAADFIGDWGGVLKIPVGKLALVLHVHENDGVLSSTLDSPDQNAFGIKADSTGIEGDALVVKISALKVRMVLRAQGQNTLAGKFHQGVGLALTLTRQSPGQKPAKKLRPQTPVPPLPYDAQDVSVQSGDGTMLGGTLVLPKGDGPFAAVVMISGSGPQDRDEAIMGHKPFLVLADALARAGIASLRADDRGVAKSEGDFTRATEQDFTKDAMALRAFLLNLPAIDPNHVGYLGHSEGGIIAPMAANGADDIAFLVLVAGPSMPLGEIILEQIKTFTPDKRAQKAALEAQKKIYAALRNDLTDEALQTRVKAIIIAAGASAEAAQMQAKTAASPWMRDALDRDAKTLIERLSIPVLALYGSLDTQVPAAIHAPLMSDALRGKNPQSKVVVLTGLNHLMQPAKTGMPDEYGDIETTMDPKALTLITDWIKAQSED